MKINRTTINYYYNLFREIINDLSENEFKSINNNCHNCCGYFLTEYGNQDIYTLYIKNDKFYVKKSICFEKCIICCNKHAFENNSFKKLYYDNFLRIKKFHGLSKSNHHIHVMETVFRINYNEDEIFKLISKKLN